MHYIVVSIALLKSIDCFITKNLAIFINSLPRYGALTFGESHNDLKKYAPKNWSESSLPEWGVYNPNTAKAWHSYRGTHALPTYLSAVNNLVLRAALPAGFYFI